MGSFAFANKSLGQHWLQDNVALGSIVNAANVTAGDTVLEIGPGTGSLTQVLLDSEAEVVALEFDESLIKPLQQKFTS